MPIYKYLFNFIGVLIVCLNVLRFFIVERLKFNLNISLIKGI